MGVTYQEPFKAFRFLVEVESGGVAVAAFTHFSGVKMTVDTVQARSGNDNRGVQEPSHVLMALGGTAAEDALSTLRFSFGSANRPGDGKEAAERLIKILEQQ